MKKLTQQEVADYLGITRPAYTAYESGKDNQILKLYKTCYTI